MDGWILGGPEFVERCRRHVASIERAPTLEEIAGAVQDVFDVADDLLRESGRHGNRPRDAAILLARELTPEKLDVVAHQFGAATRSAVTAAARRAAERATNDVEFADQLKSTRELLGR